MRGPRSAGMARLLAFNEAVDAAQFQMIEEFVGADEFTIEAEFVTEQVYGEFVVGDEFAIDDVGKRVGDGPFDRLRVKSVLLRMR